jgi:hypothetical protein
MATLLVLAIPTVVYPQAIPTIFVGPETREGFLDVDAGIRDSIGDIQRELARSRSLKLIDVREEATLALIVLGRGVVNQGSVGVGASSTASGGGSGYMIVVPHNVPTLSMMLKAGNYERLLQSSGSTWGGAAKTAVDDVYAWLDWNQEAVVALLKTQGPGR